MKTFKKIIATILMLSLCIGTLSMGTNVVSADAAKKPYMKKLKLKWDLKSNKNVKFTQPIAAIGNKKYTAKITKYKITDAKKKGYKKLTFVYTSKRNWKPSKNQVHKIANSSFAKKNASVGSGQYYTLVDYDTGANLEMENDYNVTVKSGEWKHKKYKKYSDDDKCWINLWTTSSVKVTVTYPEDYKGLCIGIGGAALLEESKADTAYWNGEKVFGQTSYYKKGKKNSHFMRVK